MATPTVSTSSAMWMTLPLGWEIGNVRAVIAFLINLLCTAGVFVVGYACWKSGAIKATRFSATQTLSLFSMTGLGDAIESLTLLKHRRTIGNRLLSVIFLQCVSVVILSVAAILSGPIAQYATRPGIHVEQRTVDGWLASKNHNSMNGALVLWNETIESLKAAQFPPDQLLDFLPDNRIDWLYKASEWNSTWAASCEWTDETEVTLAATGNYTGDFLDEVPGIRDLIPPERLAPGNNHTMDSGGSYEDDKTYRDIFVFLAAQTDPLTQRDPETGFTRNSAPLNVTLASFLFHSAPQPRPDAPDGARFGAGPIEKSTYTMAFCQIARAPGRGLDDLDESAQQNVAFPWGRSAPMSVSNALADFYGAGLISQSFNREALTHPGGRDLFRFYQAYTIAKDTQYKHAVARPDVSVAAPSVELSAPALAVLLSFVVVLLLVAVAYSPLLARVPSAAWIPRTKLQWMMEGVREVGGRDVDAAMLQADDDGSASRDGGGGGGVAGARNVGRRRSGPGWWCWGWRRGGGHHDRLRSDLVGSRYGRVVGAGGATYMTVQFDAAVAARRSMLLRRPDADRMGMAGDEAAMMGSASPGPYYSSVTVVPMESGVDAPDQQQWLRFPVGSQMQQDYPGYTKG